jgi:hypothetical protein
MAREVNPVVKSYLEAFETSLDFCKPMWDIAIANYEMFKLKKFSALTKTHSQIAINLHHSMVVDRAPKIQQNVFGSTKLISLIPTSPASEPFREENEAWIRDLYSRVLNIRYESMSTVIGALICGTSYRMPYVSWGGGIGDSSLKRVIDSCPKDFFSVLPAPTGGYVNPSNKGRSSAVDYVFVVDWMSNDKIEKLAKAGIFNKEEAGAMLDSKNQSREDWPELQYQNRFAYANQISYGGTSTWRNRLEKIKQIPNRRRVVHWFLRDKWYIVGEDAFLLYEGDPIAVDENGDGVIPIAKYATCPDGDNWFGIPYLSLIDDILKAMIMNVNFRFDHLLSIMFPQTYIRDDVRQGKPLSSFRRVPNALHSFPMTVQDISKAIYYDQGKGVDQQAFVDENSLKALLQKVAGASETTSSLNDVVGNKTATGVTAIMGELMGRPNMESINFEMGGLREETKILLYLADKYIDDDQLIRSPEIGGFPWFRVRPEVLNAAFDVETHGTTYMSEKNINFQKLIAYAPLINQSPVFDEYEKQKQMAEIADVLPHPDRALIKPSPMEAGMLQGATTANAQGIGGAASPFDLTQQAAGQEMQEAGAV